MILSRLLALVAVLMLAAASTDMHAYASRAAAENAHRGFAAEAATGINAKAALTADRTKENRSAAAEATSTVCFPGQYFDAETQSNYNYFRDYEAATGRYLKSDPAGQLFAINGFSYVDASPLQSFDWSGLGRIGDFTKDQKEEQFKLNPRCHYCGKLTIRCLTPHPDRFNMDHFEPLAGGGTGSSKNGVSSCQTCNLKKYTKPGTEFIAESGTWKGTFFRAVNWLRGRGRR